MAESGDLAPKIQDQEEEEEDATGEDKGADYRLLARLNRRTGPGVSIPKRGEKDFEPLQLGINVQERALRESREAMFGALEGFRGGAGKTISHAHLALPSAPTDPTPLPYLVLIRGNHLATMGHNVKPPSSSLSPLPSTSSSDPPKPSSKEPRLVLLPEEALYLLERGSLMIWRGEMDDDATEMAKAIDSDKTSERLPEEIFGKRAVPMSVQEGWALWGDQVRDGKYTVYAQLKRLGYTVHRASRSDYAPSFSPKPASTTNSLISTSTSRPLVPPCIYRLGLRLFSSILSPVTLLYQRLRSLLQGHTSAPAACWTPLIGRSTLVPSSSSTRIFSQLRIPSSPPSSPPASTTLPTAINRPSRETNPYAIYFHVWKPSSNYKKSSPGPPDFEIGVVDARKHPLPSHDHFSQIFSSLPDLPPPPVRLHPNQQHRQTLQTPQPASTSSPFSFPRFLQSLFGRSSPMDGDEPPKGQHTNPFPTLKQGDRAWILAVVDCGVVSWLRLGRGVFEENPIQ